MIFCAMIFLGMLLGFAGAGGAGLTITLLTVGFGIPIHVALGVALAAMSFTMLSGAISHFREGDVLLRLGLTTGVAGMAGAFCGAQVSDALPGAVLSKLTAALMLASSCLLYFILFRKELLDAFVAKHKSQAEGASFYLHALVIGVVTGFLSGAFGIGATAFIQISLMLFFGISLYNAIGTTMLVILPISLSGGFGYLLNGHLDFYIFGQTLCGLTIGAYFGAKLTRLASRNVLRYIILSMPTIGGILLLVK